MSAIATFHTLPREYLLQLVEDADEVLERFGTESNEEYGWSGYCLANVVDYLATRGVDLFATSLQLEAEAMSGDWTVLLLTTEHHHLLPQLDPSHYDDDSLRTHFREMGMDFEEAPLAARDAIELLRDELAALKADDILVVRIG